MYHNKYQIHIQLCTMTIRSKGQAWTINIIKHQEYEDTYIKMQIKN